MFRAAALSLAFLSALSLFPANGQEAASAADPHLSAALDLLEVTNAKANTLRIVDTLAPLIINQVRAQHPNATSAAMERFQGAFQEEILADMDGLMKSSAQLYEERFTESELRALADFYGSEAGKKYLNVMPIVLKQSLPMGATWGPEAALHAAQRAIARLHANGVDL